MAKDQKIKKNPLNYRLSLVDTVGRDFSWYFDIVHASRSISAHFLNQTLIKGISNWFMTGFWSSLITSKIILMF
jgi:hypothetical protein